MDTLRAFYRLESLRAQMYLLWDRVGCLIVPTTPTLYRIDAVKAEPIRLNTQLNVYKRFVNLLDLSAVAVPSGFPAQDLPTYSP